MQKGLDTSLCAERGNEPRLESTLRVPEALRLEFVGRPVAAAADSSSS